MGCTGGGGSSGEDSDLFVSILLVRVFMGDFEPVEGRTPPTKVMYMALILSILSP